VSKSKRGDGQCFLPSLEIFRDKIQGITRIGSSDEGFWEREIPSKRNTRVQGGFKNLALRILGGKLHTNKNLHTTISKNLSYAHTK
jgi:hypothetical protein